MSRRYRGRGERHQASALGSAHRVEPLEPSRTLYPGVEMDVMVVTAIAIALIWLSTISLVIALCVMSARGDRVRGSDDQVRVSRGRRAPSQRRITSR